MRFTLKPELEEERLVAKRLKHLSFINLLDIVILICKLLIVKAKLIHKVGGHLLDLVLGEGLSDTSPKTLN